MEWRWIALGSLACLGGMTWAAPQWLRQADICTGYYRSAITAEQAEEALAAYPFVVWGNPCLNQETWRRLQAQGVRALAYVSLYKAPSADSLHEAPNWDRGDPSRAETEVNPFWRAVSLVEHPEWTLIGPEGKIKRKFNATYNAWPQTCTNVAGYREAVVRGARELMALGLDGLFVDNAHPEKQCWGPKFGKHEHQFPDQDNEATYCSLLEEVVKVVRSYGRDKAVLINGGGLLGKHDLPVDGAMWESFICSSAWPDRRPGWEQVKRRAARLRRHLEAGKVWIALSYLGHTGYNPVEDAFWCCAAARACGFIWADWGTTNGRLSQILRHVRLGLPRSEIESTEGVDYRVFEQGIVAINAAEKAVTASLPAPPGVSALLDVRVRKDCPVQGGRFEAQIPAESGRVYVPAEQLRNAPWERYLAQEQEWQKQEAARLAKIQPKYEPAPVTTELKDEDFKQIAEAELRLDVFGTNSGKYAGKRVLLNGEAIGELPETDRDEWVKDLRIKVPARLVRRENRLEIRNETNDCFNVNRVYLWIKLQDGREAATGRDVTGYTSAPKWRKGRGLAAPRVKGLPLPEMRLRFGAP